LAQGLEQVPERVQVQVQVPELVLVPARVPVPEMV
jgi:hypothetical protein